MSRPVLIDAFCKAGGATRGYQRAGFYVIGIDIEPQPNYCGDEFIQADALEVLTWIADPAHATGQYLTGDFDAIHASPPCQAYSVMTRGYGTAHQFPDLMAATRELLQGTGLPWVIENVPGAPMRADFKLCGCIFDLEAPGVGPLRRVRLFETSWHGFQLREPCHHKGYAITVTGHPGRKWKNGPRTILRDCQAAMGIDWMTGDELSEAIPPVYTEYIGGQLLEHLQQRGAA